MDKHKAVPEHHVIGLPKSSMDLLSLRIGMAASAATPVSPASAALTESVATASSPGTCGRVRTSSLLFDSLLLSSSLIL